MDRRRSWPAGDPAAQMQAAFLAAAGADADVARSLLDVVSCLALPAEVMGRPGLLEKVSALARTQPVPTPGTTRAQLLALMD